MIIIENYMTLSRENRKEHINLSESCLERGGYYNNYRGVLAQYLDTEFPSGFKIVLCHACNNDKCSNPKHMYWGTRTENIDDYHKSGGMTFGQRVASKPHLRKTLRENGKRVGESRKGKPSNNPTGKNQYAK
jgi:hypothetical protein